jgi:hypothetical protein
MDISCNPGIISVTSNTVAGEKKEYMHSHTDAEKGIFNIFYPWSWLYHVGKPINANIKPLQKT